LIKSSFGSIVGSCCGSADVCAHFGLPDAIVAEATCDGKKKMYELLRQYAPVYVMDLPQMPEMPAAQAYYLGELERFKGFLEEMTGEQVTDARLRAEIRSANGTRRLLQRLFDYRKRDSPPVTGMEVLKVMQKQFFMAPDDFRAGISALCEDIESMPMPSGERKPRIMIAGCPMSSGNTKVPEIIESRGALIVVEESCTGTRAFENLVDESKPSLQAIAERYLKIPCACMTPNDRRIDEIVAMAREYRADGVVHYTLQGCRGYNIEKHRVQQALKKAKIPMLAIETDYSTSDTGQIGLRVDAFLEMIV
jgi:benzoyl-CoA reductase/2-hydroxyglutaryl-CoA dehydratase subunit BcrC/BadD/HgdB